MKKITEEELRKQYEGKLLKYLITSVEVYMTLDSAERLSHNHHITVWCQE